MHLDITLESATGCSQQHSQYSTAANPPAACLDLLKASQLGGSTQQGYIWQHHSPDHIDHLLHQQLLHHQAATPGHYYLFLLPSMEPLEASVTVGQHRHAWLQYSGDGSTISSELLKVAAKQVLDGSFAAKAGTWT